MQFVFVWGPCFPVKSLGDTQQTEDSHSIARSGMFEKRLAVALCLLALFWGGRSVSGQGYLEQAAERAADGEYPEAISLYKRAIDSQSSGTRKLEIQKTLDEVTRQYFAYLYDQAVAAGSRDEKVDLLAQTRNLELHGWVATDFEQVVIATQRLTNEIFEQLRQEAESAAQGRALDEAVSIYDKARRLDPLTFERNNLERAYQAVLEQIRRGRELGIEGARLLGQRRFEEARTAFEEADRLYPGQEVVDSGLQRTNSMLLLLEGERWMDDNRFRRAESAFERALAADQSNEAASSRLESSREYRESVHAGRLLYTQGNCEQSKIEFQKARESDPERFGTDNFESIPGGDCSGVFPFPRWELEEALVSLFSGKQDFAIEILEALFESLGESHVEISAFLGAAYGYRAFTRPDGDDAALERAREHFRKVLTAQPDYRLPERLFSPRILKLFEETRAGQL